ncbi:phosphatase PAP2 family protein [Cryomorphaceae bacterium]|nr:phosphatase PAP2 family protein [Cryomorphaceae bacterium]
MPAYQEVQPYEWYQVFDLPAPELYTIDRGAIENWNPEIAKNSDYVLGGLMLLPFASLASQEVQEQAGTYLFMYGEVLVSTGLITAAIKGWTERARPYVYNNTVPLEERISQSSMRSFVSGHTALAFGAASFMSTTYMDLHPDDPFRWVVLAGTFGAAGLVGYMRVESGQHFPTDVIAGAAIGTAIGWAIPALHREARYRGIRWNAGWNQFRLVWDF